MHRINVHEYIIFYLTKFVMKNFRFLWRHEVRQADWISRKLIHRRKIRFGWGVSYLPNLLLEAVRSKRNLSSTRKNLLFTKKKAFKAAGEVVRGEDRSIRMGYIEIETKELLDREKKGYYTEKVRRKQLQEIELLVDHFLSLMKTGGNTYGEAVHKAYPTKKHYLAFIKKIERAEQDVVHAAVTGLRKGSKKERVTWFHKVQEVTRSIRMEDVERLYPVDEKIANPDHEDIFSKHTDQSA